jgi:hypothetical protein
VALVLLGVLLMPLVTGMLSAVNRADAVRRQAGRLSLEVAAAGRGDAWEWGAQVVSALWQPGPTLHVSVCPNGAGERFVGLWLDGWFLGERSPDAEGDVCLGASEWSGATGRELVVRARDSEGTWGPPARLSVPDAGGAPPVSSFTGRRLVPGDAVVTDDKTVLHVPALASPLIGVLQDDVEVTEDSLGLLSVVIAPTCGRCDLSLDARAQSWEVEDGRALDVYF